MTDDIVDELRLWSDWLDDRCPDAGKAPIELLRAAKEIERLRKERDEARREVSYLRPSVTLGAQTAVEYAKSRGWDCFKGATDDNA